MLIISRSANGRGFINLEADSGFDFPDKIAGLSVFHQLHCLVSMPTSTLDVFRNG